MKIKWKILIFLILFIMILAIIFPKPIRNLDEIWNFNFAKNIADGKLPYKDFNMVQLPLLHYVAAIFLTIFGTELIVMRLLGGLLCAAILFMVFQILILLKVNKSFSWITVLGIYLLFFDYFCFDYNYGTLLVTLIVLYFELKRVMNGKEIFYFNLKTDLLMGILIGSTIIMKQTTGLFICVIFILHKLLLAKSKEDFKSVLKIIAARGAGVIIPALLFILYLIINNIWADFINYAILGIATFSNYIPYMNLLKDEKFIIKVLSMVAPITILIMYYISIVKQPNNKEKQAIFILFCYSIATFIIAFPISDQIHLLIAILPTIISIIYLIWQLCIWKKPKIKNKIILYFREFFKVLCVVSALVILCYYSYLLCISINKSKVYTDLEHFKFVEPFGGIYQVRDYILEQKEKGNTVYILDSAAAVYMIPSNNYNKDYDMFLKGNIGNTTEEEQIEKLKQMDSLVIILILNPGNDRNWQNPHKVTDYIIKEWNKTGEVFTFDIYEK